SRELNIDMKSAPKESTFKKTMATIMRNRNLIVVFISYTVTLGTHCLYKDLGSTMIKNRCSPNTDADGTSLYSYTVLAGSIAGTVASLVAGPIGKVIGEKGLCYVGQAMGMIALAFVAFDADGAYNYYWYTAAFALNRFGEGLDHPSFIQLCSEWASPEDRGMMLGLFQIGNSLGRSVFSLLQGYLYDWNYTASYFIAMAWPLIGYVCIAVASVPVQAHMLEKARREQACAEETPIESVPV
ncbi:major facilitator superfamily protein, partial [Kipferlia bialata]